MPLRPILRCSTARRLAGAGCLLALILAGCSFNAPRPGQPPPETEPDLDTIARDLVFALAQVEGLHPMQTTVQVAEPSTDFGRLLIGRIEDAGYGIQQVSADQGDRYLSYVASRAYTDAGEQTSYTVAMGTISASRDYALADGGTVPRSPLSIDGAEQQPIELHRELFGDAAASGAGVDRIAFAEQLSPVVIDLSSGSVTTFSADGGAPTTASPAPDQIAAVPGPAATVSDPASFGGAVKRNIYDTLESNYARLFVDYEDIRRDVLVFDNDSLKLGDRNKGVLEVYVDQMNPDTDVISVLGCSHGRSAIEQGNALLAIGRANRVKEGLIFAGIDHRRVLEEGCWAPEHFDEVMPRRGVVLTLKRLKATG